MLDNVVSQQQQQMNQTTIVEEEPGTVPTGNGDIVNHAPPLQVSTI